MQVLEGGIRLRCRPRLERQRLQLALLRERHDFLQLLKVADVRADDADGALRDRRQRMHQLPAVQADEDVAPAFAQRRDAAGRGGRRADEVDRAGDAGQLLRRLRIARVERVLCPELRRRLELSWVDVAGDDVLHAARAQHRDAGKADAAAADDRHAVLAREQRQLGTRAVGREARAGERRSESLVDTGSVEQVFRIGHEQVRRIGAGAVDAEDAASRDTVVVLSRLAHRALAAADPRKHDPLLTHAHALRLRAQRLDHAEGLMAEREGRHAAALLDVEALAAAEVEIAMPDVEIRVTHAGARDAHEDLGALRLRRFERHLLQRLAVLDDLVADHALAAAASAWSMSQRMSSSVSMPTDMRTMSGVTPAFARSASSICRCVVDAGWITSVLASPMLARWLMNCAASMKRSPALAPPLTPKLSRPEAPLGRYFLASA